MSTKKKLKQEDQLITSIYCVDSNSLFSQLLGNKILQQRLA